MPRQATQNRILRHDRTAAQLRRGLEPTRRMSSTSPEAPPAPPSRRLCPATSSGCSPCSCQRPARRATDCSTSGIWQGTQPGYRCACHPAAAYIPMHTWYTDWQAGHELCGILVAASMHHAPGQQCKELTDDQITKLLFLLLAPPGYVTESLPRVGCVVPAGAAAAAAVLVLPRRHPARLGLQGRPPVRAVRLRSLLSRHDAVLSVFTGLIQRTQRRLEMRTRRPVRLSLLRLPGSRKA